MQVCRAYSFSTFTTVGRLILAVAVMLTTFGWASGQEPASRSRTNRHEWHKYVNQRYGFSFWYPDTYQSVSPADTDGRCVQSKYHKCLLWLALRDDPETIIWVGLSRMHPGLGESTPIPQKIGNHLFYCGIVGSMGVGYSDFCILKLKGKALEFQFSQPRNMNSNERTNPVVPKMLKTFRTL